MSFQRLPRLNPCLPCVVGNPRGVQAGDVIRPYGIVSPKQKHPPLYEVLRRAGRYYEVRPLGARRASGVLTLGEEDFDFVSRGNPCGPSVHIDMPGAHAARGHGRTVEVNRNPDPAASTLRQEAMRLRALGNRSLATRYERFAQEIEREHQNPRRNPKLLVLNPSSDPLAAEAERRLGRRLTPAEHRQLSLARREFKTFQGREVGPGDLMLVDAPPGSPLFLSYVGHEERRDYAVKIDSARRGKWTHKAGDHGGRKHTAPAIIASVPGRKKHNVVTVLPKGSRAHFRPTHGLMG